MDERMTMPGAAYRFDGLHRVAVAVYEVAVHTSASVSAQSDGAADVLFRRRQAVEGLMPRLLTNSPLSFEARAATADGRTVRPFNPVVRYDPKDGAGANAR